MSGTALENKVDEMISLIKPLRPDIARTVEGMAFMPKAPQFREAVAPVYYRRKREDVLTELPELIEKEEWCTLLHQEEYIYENAVLSKQYAASRRVSWSVDDPAFSSKALRLKELVEEAASDGRKVLVFSFFLDTIDMVMRTLGDRCVNPINGSITPQQRQEIIDEDRCSCIRADSFAAALDLSAVCAGRKPVLVLNFANPVNIGGGVYRGARAQEEDLCRRSSLLRSLENSSAEGYYRYNRSLGTYMGSDAMIFSPEVEVFRDEEYALMEETAVVAVVTCAAPLVNYGLEGIIRAWH